MPSTGALARLASRRGADAGIQRLKARRHRRLPDVRVRARIHRAWRRPAAGWAGGLCRRGRGAACRARAGSTGRTPRRPITSSPVSRPTGTSSPVTWSRWRLAPGVNAAILLVLAAMVFVPIGYVYPSRTPQLRGVTVSLGTSSGGAGGVADPGAARSTTLARARLAALPGVHVLLSFYLHAQRRPS